MPIYEIVFYVFSLVMLGGAVMVITVRNPVYAALSLVLTFFSASAIWIVFNAAPLRRLSLDMNMESPLGIVSSGRIRRTSDGSMPAAFSGVGMSSRTTPSAVERISRARSGVIGFVKPAVIANE